jgi:uncharacterized protein YwqG
MGLLRKLFGKKAGTTRETAEEILAGKIVALFKERTAVETLRMIPTRERCSPRDSKLGGVPYLPAGFAYPLDRREGREHVPLRFLAQLNFGEMPALEGFPREGMLQFYIGNDEAYGLDHETMTAQKGFRVVYHETVADDAPPAVIPAMPADEALVDFPLDGESRLRFERETAIMGADDFRFDALLLKFYNEVNPAGAVRSLDRVNERVLDGVYARVTTGGHRVGGYPAFAQLDPREYHEYLRGHTVLLFQLDSVETDDYAIRWRDDGCCHFFIRPDDLAAREFADVLYSWDCY